MENDSYHLQRPKSKRLKTSGRPSSARSVEVGTASRRSGFFSETNALSSQFGFSMSIGEVLQQRLRENGRVTRVFPDQSFEASIQSIADLSRGVGGAIAVSIIHTNAIIVVSQDGARRNRLDVTGNRLVIPRRRPDVMAVFGNDAGLQLVRLDHGLAQAAFPSSSPALLDCDIAADGFLAASTKIANDSHDLGLVVGLHDLRTNHAGIPISTYGPFPVLRDHQTNIPIHVRMLSEFGDKILLHCPDGMCCVFDVRMNRTGRDSAVNSFQVTGDVLPAQWDAGKSEWIPGNAPHAGPVTQLCSLMDGDRILTGCDDEGFRLWSCSSGRVLEAFPAACGRFTPVIPPADLMGPVMSFYAPPRCSSAVIGEWSFKAPTEAVHMIADAALLAPSCGVVVGSSGLDGLLVGTHLGRIAKWSVA